MPANENPTWPVLTRYDRDHLSRIGLPLGGIGTGTISLGGRGNLFDWEITNSPAKGFDGGRALGLLWVKPDGEEPTMRVLEGVLSPPYDGAKGAQQPWHGLPRFRKALFAVAYPLAQVLLSDPGVPLDVRLEAFNPLIPGDADASGLPVAVLRYVLRNGLDIPVTATVCLSVRNYLTNTERSSPSGAFSYVTCADLHGIILHAVGQNPQSPQAGSIALSTPSANTRRLLGWPDQRFDDALLHFWDDLLRDGRLSSSDTPVHPYGSLAARVHLEPGQETTIPFLLTWHFPNRQTWTPEATCWCDEKGSCDPLDHCVGNYYTTRFADAWDVARTVASHLSELEEQTVSFVRAFCESDLPEPVKEGALNNLSTLRSETCFRTEDGRFFGWEGCCDREGCCLGSCTHVWNYDQATPHLFGDLARSMRETQFLHATDERGRMAFRVHLPIERATEYPYAAADGQMGCIIKAYRDWQLSGDDVWLLRMWPRIKSALSFAWIEGGWDADRDGVMEGCQHHTLDVEYFGPNPLTGLWYLGALRAAEEMARHIGEDEFAETCRDVFSRGSAWIDEHLFNGEYYEQQIVAPGEEGEIAEGLHSNMGSARLDEPDYQLGSGCLVDHLVGQLMAHICALGYLVAEDHVRSALRSILRYNHRHHLYDHMNYMRTFALNDESALLMCTWPHGRRPRTPVRFASEVMTGFEYAAATHMLYEGMLQEGLDCITEIRNRYDGQRRNPFDEAECGHHYARAMCSWAAVLALSGFQYSALTGALRFTARPGRYFWSNGSAWGTCTIRKEAKGRTALLTVLHGSLTVRSLQLGEEGTYSLPTTRSLTPGATLCAHIDLASLA